MNLEETVTLMTWVNQYDPRIQINKPARDIWANALQPYTYDESMQAVLDHYRVSDDESVTPAKIRKRAELVRNQRTGRQSAIEANPKQSSKHPMSWRARNPKEWDRLMEQSRQERRADLKARGLL